MREVVGCVVVTLLVALTHPGCGDEGYYLDRRANLQCSVSAACNRGVSCLDADDLAGSCGSYDEELARECLRALRKLNRELRGASDSEKDQLCDVPAVCDLVHGGGPCAD